MNDWREENHVMMYGTRHDNEVLVSVVLHLGMPWESSLTYHGTDEMDVRKFTFQKIS
jgi:hypothetical protein